jgi:hypothetical protein
MKRSYRRLALVTSRDQLDQLDAGDEGTLIVSCDWLLWQQALTEGRHAVHYELGIVSWDEPDTLDKDLYIRANDWLYGDDGRDMTLFHGVSLGKLFCSDIAMGLMNFHRIKRSLVSLIKRFRVEEIVYFDFASDITVLDLEMRKGVVHDIVEKQGLRFSDRSGANADDRLSMSENPTTLRGHGFLKNAALFLYTRALEMLTNLRALVRRPDKRVLIVGVTNIVQPLARNFPGGRKTPIFMSRALPKKFGLLWHCLKKGILLIEPKTVILSQADPSCS